MKRVFFLLMLCVILVLLLACTKMEALYEAGLYCGQSEGYYSNVLVEVEVDEYHILNIEIISHEEPEILSKIVFKELPPRIMKQNGTDIDAISGATYTSMSLLNAVEKALDQARK